jgi:hypothetical protein
MVTKAWHYNDGAGLTGTQAEQLAKLLQAKIDCGETAIYEERWRLRQASRPHQPCQPCKGTGTRRDPLGVQYGYPDKIVPEPRADDPEGPNPRTGQIGYCNGCDGRGHVRDPETWYHFDVVTVQEFVHFLRACGGFRIV